MSEALKKPDDEFDESEIDSSPEESKDSKGAVSDELMMLENLKKLRESTKVTQIAPMKEEDLEYPDMPSSSDSVEDIGELPEVPDVDAIGDIDDIENLDDLDDIGDLSDLDEMDDVDEIPKAALVEEEDDFDDPTKGGFELPSSILAPGSSDAIEEEENEEGLDEDDSTDGGTKSKREELRLKRKKALEQKRKEREEEEKRKEEERQRQRELEKQQNILSVEELKKQALSQDDFEEVHDDFDLGEMDEAPPKNTGPAIDLFSAKATPPSLKFEKVEEKIDKNRPSYSNSEITQTTQYVLQETSRGKRILKVVGGLCFDLFKGILPAAIVWFYVQESAKKNVSIEALEHLSTADSARVELGLLLLKNNFDPSHNKYYYDLVKKRVEFSIEKSWKDTILNPAQVGLILKENGSYTFRDPPHLDLPKIIGELNQSNASKLQELYENFYDVESKNIKEASVIDNLRQANIFLRQGQCLKAYERFDNVLRKYNDSYAAKQGGTLAVHCAYEKNYQEAADYFQKREAIVKLESLQKPEEKQPEPQVVVEEKPAPAPQQRAPASSKKNKRK